MSLGLKHGPMYLTRPLLVAFRWVLPFTILEAGTASWECALNETSGEATAAASESREHQDQAACPVEGTPFMTTS